MKLTFLLAIIFSSFLFCQSQNTIKVAGIVKSIDGEILNGANIVRVHDVKEMVRVVKIADEILYSDINIM